MRVLPVFLLMLAAIAIQADEVARPEPPVAGAGLDAKQLRAVMDGVVAEVAEIRGLAFREVVPVHVIDRDQVREHASERLGELQAEALFERGRRAYVAMKLIPADFDLWNRYLDVMEEQAGGYYDPKSGAFYVLQRIPEALAPAVMAHELTHALEDQHFDLDGRIRENLADDDRLFADSAVHEGSAMLVMTLVLGRMAMRGDLGPEMGNSLALFDSDQEVLKALPPVLVRQLAAPYAIGPSFLMRGSMLTVLNSGVPGEEIDGVYADPPRSSEQILHPEKYWDPERRDDPRRVELGSAGEALGSGWSREHQGVLGELNLAALVGAGAPLDGDPAAVLDARSWTDPAAAGWGGDRYELWTRDGEDRVLLGSLWDDPHEAAEFAAGLPTDPGLRWSRRGAAVAVLFGGSEAESVPVLAAILDAIAPTGS